MLDAIWGQLQQTSNLLIEQSYWLLAQGDDAADGVADAPNAINPFLQFFANPLNLILISAILFMLIVVKPQQKQLKQHQRALADLKKNDRVVTAAGIHGTVVQITAEDPTVTIRIDENTGARMTINRETIAKIINNSENKE